MWELLKIYSPGQIYPGQDGQRWGKYFNKYFIGLIAVFKLEYSVIMWTPLYGKGHFS